MKRVLAVLLVLFLAAGGIVGFAGAAEAETPDLALPTSAPVSDVIQGYAGFGEPSSMPVYHPLSMIFFDTDVTLFEAFSSLVWLSSEMTDGNPGFYYEKILYGTTIPEDISYFSAF